MGNSPLSRSRLRTYGPMMMPMNRVASSFKELDSSTEKIKLCDITKQAIPSDLVLYSVLEAERPLPPTLTGHEMISLKTHTDHVSRPAWPLEVGSPAGLESAHASGVARLIMIEQPAFTFCTFDVRPGCYGIPPYST